MPSSASVMAAVCQFAPTGDVARNRAKITEFVGEAARRNARITIFPEYANYFVNPFDHSIAEHAETLEGPFVEHLQGLSREHDIVIVSGLLQRSDHDERPYNTAVAVDEDGVVAVYHKQHLYDAFGHRESDWIKPGALIEPQVFTVDGMKFGILTCYDLRFPETTRLVVDAGAEGVIVPAEWVQGPLKEFHWNTLLATRAIENTAFVLAADHPPPNGVGLSQIIGPDGIRLAAVSTGEAIGSALIRRSDLQQVRATNPALKLRRYRVINPIG